MSDRPRRWLRRVLLIGISLVISLLLVEIALRLLNPWLHLDLEIQGFAAHDTWHHQRRPGLDLTFPLRDGTPTRLQTNELGMPDPRSISPTKPAGSRRILVLGDSFTEGYHREDSVAARLEVTLNQAGRGPTEVYNAGQSSYSPLLHLVRLRHQWLSLAPDGIVINVDLTDVYDDYWRYRPHLVATPDGAPDRVPETNVSLKRLVTPLLDVSYLGRLLGRVWKRTPRTGGDGTAPPPLEEHVFGYHIPGSMPEGGAAAVEYCLGNLARCVDLCRARGVEVAITTYPHRQQIEPDREGRLWHRDVAQRIEGLCRDKGVPYFSAYRAIRDAHHADAPLYWADDMHLNPRGQRVWADAVAAFYAALPVKAAGSQ